MLYGHETFDQTNIMDLLKETLEIDPEDPDFDLATFELVVEGVSKLLLLKKENIIYMKVVR